MNNSHGRISTLFERLVDFLTQDNITCEWDMETVSNESCVFSVNAFFSDDESYPFITLDVAQSTAEQMVKCSINLSWFSMLSEGVSDRVTLQVGTRTSTQDILDWLSSHADDFHIAKTDRKDVERASVAALMYAQYILLETSSTIAL